MTLRQYLRAFLTSVPRVRPEMVGERIRSGEALLVDVREPREWESGIAEHAALLPLSDIRGDRTHWKPFLEQARGRELILYCKMGGRSLVAAKILAAEGFRASDGGGIREWSRAGWPVVKRSE